METEFSKVAKAEGVMTEDPGQVDCFSDPSEGEYNPNDGYGAIFY